MDNQLFTYQVGDWTVFGQTFFRPPFKVSDALINEARIVYVHHGTSRLYSANQYVNLEGGDLLIMKTDNFINNWHQNETDSPNEVIVFQLTADLLKHLYDGKTPEWFVQGDTKAPSIQKVEKSPMIDSYFSNLRDYLRNPGQLTEELVKLKTKELILLLVQSKHSGPIQNIFGNLFMATDFAFKEVIQQNLFETLNVDDLAFLTGMSLSSFKRKFSSVYATSPNKYITSKRLEKAQTLLTTTELNITEIAYDCGFSDVGYFSKTFRKHYNISPSSLRRAI